MKLIEIVDEINNGTNQIGAIIAFERKGKRLEYVCLINDVNLVRKGWYTRTGARLEYKLSEALYDVIARQAFKGLING